MNLNFCIDKDGSFKVVLNDNNDDAVKIAAGNLVRDIYEVTGICEDTNSKIHIFIYTYSCDVIPDFVLDKLPKNNDGTYKSEGFVITVSEGEMHICGADRRGTIYGIYELSRLIGVSPWYWWADVPVKKKYNISFNDGFSVADYPSVAYRGIFINDEEELENWVKKHMGEETIGIKTYEHVFELLLRLKANYIWPAMHVNSFNTNVKNGELAYRMGIVVGTSHCDILMRSNNHEWDSWLNQTGLQGTEYDYSIEGKNRENLDRYWRESVIQNSDFEVSWTLGMRGIHDWGMGAVEIDKKDITDREKDELKKQLLERVITKQRELIKEFAPNNDKLQIFVPYKEVLKYYNIGLNVPDNVTIIWVNDNFGYIRSYPNDTEQQRSGGHGLYYHISYWAAPAMDYLFISSLPFAHMKNELRKAYENGIQKLWVLNIGAIKPLELDMEFFLSYAWDIDKEKSDTDDVLGYIESRIDRDFSGNYGKECAKILNDFAQITNVRKLEHMKEDAFYFTSFVDEWSDRINRLKKCYDSGNKIYFSLPENERDAFFELVLMKIHASYYINSEYYYADRSRKSYKEGKMQAADEYTKRSKFFDHAKRKMLDYYNNVMRDGKWSDILTPELYPPPVYTMHPACQMSLAMDKPKMMVSIADCINNKEIHFYGDEQKWIEIANGGKDTINYYIECTDGIYVSNNKGVVSYETRITLKMDGTNETGIIKIVGSDGTIVDINAIHHDIIDNVIAERDGRIIITAEDFKTDTWKLVKYAGRYTGGLIEAQNENTSVNIDVYINTSGNHILELYRFPTLSSKGQIRAEIIIDGKESVFVKSDANDEWTGAWRTNVMDNVDRIFVELPHMENGIHNIEIKAIDRYFGLSRAVIYTNGYKVNNLGIEVTNHELPEFTNEVPIYGKLKVLPRAQVYTKCRDWSCNRLGITNIRIETKEFAKQCNSSRFGICKEVDGDILIDASRAFVNDDVAFTTGGVWKHCNCPSYGETGIAAFTELSDNNFTDVKSAPTLNYNIDIKDDGKYIVWILTKVNNEDRQSVSLGIDGDYQPVSEQFMNGNIWTYEAKQIWRWIPFTEIEFSKGIHLFSIASLHSGMRLDRIFITKTDKLPPNDTEWK